MPSLASVVDVETVSGQPVAFTDEARVQRLLDLASDVVRAFTGQTFDFVTNDMVIVRVGDGDLILPQRPVTAVTSVTINGAALNVAEYRWNSTGRLYRMPFGWFGYELPWYGLEASVTYSHGYLSPPDWLAAIVSNMVATALATPAESRALNLERVGNYEVRYRDTPDSLLTIPPSAKTLLLRKLGRSRVGVMTLAPVNYGSRVSWDHR